MGVNMTVPFREGVKGNGGGRVGKTTLQIEVLVSGVALPSTVSQLLMITVAVGHITLHR